MKLIDYEITFQTPDDVIHELVTVRARDINSGASKALLLSLAGRAKLGHEFVRIEFAQVLS